MHKKLPLAVLLNALHCWHLQASEGREDMMELNPETDYTTTRQELNNPELTEEQKERERESLLQAQEARARNLKGISGQRLKTSDTEQETNNSSNSSSNLSQENNEPTTPSQAAENAMEAALENNSQNATIIYKGLNSFNDTIKNLNLPKRIYKIINNNSYYLDIYEDDPKNFLDNLAKNIFFTNLCTIKMADVFDARTLNLYGKDYRNEINRIAKSFNELQNRTGDSLKAFINAMNEAEKKVIFNRALAQSTLPEPLKTIISDNQNSFLSCKNQSNSRVA